jgi:hypothetical protein
MMLIEDELMYTTQPPNIILSNASQIWIKYNQYLKKH